ncbi:MAG: xerD 1 [Gemmataceae bacterium]|nr:xerD 1 [Gemmataceae bacterium]
MWNKLHGKHSRPSRTHRNHELTVLTVFRPFLRPAAIPRTDLPTEGANGKEHADFHALRHSFVSALADKDGGPKLLPVLARHSDPRITLGRYTHIDRDQLAGAVARLPGVGTLETPTLTLTREQLEVGLLFFAAVAGCVLLFGSATGPTSTPDKPPKNLT